MSDKILTPATAMDETLFVVADTTDGALLGMDDASGGYPWKPSYWGGVRIWTNLKDAEKYASGGFHANPCTVLCARVVFEEADPIELAKATMTREADMGRRSNETVEEFDQRIAVMAKEIKRQEDQNGITTE